MDIFKIVMITEHRHQNAKASVQAYIGEDKIWDTTTRPTLCVNPDWALDVCIDQILFKANVIYEKLVEFVKSVGDVKVVIYTNHPDKAGSYPRGMATSVNIMIAETEGKTVPIEIRDIEELSAELEDIRFETGAVREPKEGKGRCDLLPAAALLRLAKHYERGAVRYGERNWEKGLPMSSYLDSGVRHILRYLDGQRDEDHLAAAAWNILGAMWTEDKFPELIDIPTEFKRGDKDE